MQSRLNPLKDHSALRVCTNYCQGLAHWMLMFHLVSPKIERFPYAWPAQVLLVTCAGWWIRPADERMSDDELLVISEVWHALYSGQILGEFRARICSVLFSVMTNMTRSLGTYRDRRAVSHWGGNGLFNWLPVSCEDISWLRENCHTALNSLLLLSLQ